MKIRLFKHKKRPFIPAGNYLYIGDTICNDRIPKMNLIIKGTGNIIRMHPRTQFNIQCDILISGDNNVLNFEQTSINKCNITILANNCRLSWGARTTSSDARILMAEYGTVLEIGHDCMLANADIRTSDGHAIYDIETGRIINKRPKEMRIGNHVWLGQNTLLTKNANLPDHTIVGAHSVVSKTFHTKNTIIAGIPAKCIKTGVRFSRPNPSEFDEHYSQDIENEFIRKYFDL